MIWHFSVINANDQKLESPQWSLGKNLNANASSITPSRFIVWAESIRNFEVDVWQDPVTHELLKSDVREIGIDYKAI